MFWIIFVSVYVFPIVAHGRNNVIDVLFAIYQVGTFSTYLAWLTVGKMHESK